MISSSDRDPSSDKTRYHCQLIATRDQYYMYSTVVACVSFVANELTTVIACNLISAIACLHHSIIAQISRHENHDIERNHNSHTHVVCYKMTSFSLIHEKLSSFICKTGNELVATAAGGRRPDVFVKYVPVPAARYHFLNLFIRQRSSARRAIFDINSDFFILFENNFSLIICVNFDAYFFALSN